MIKILINIIIAVLGAYVFRMRGGGFALRLPRPIEQAIFCLPYGAIAYLASSLWLDPLYIWINTLSIYIVCVVTCLSGHGVWFTLGYYREKWLEPERYDFIVKVFFGEDPRYKK